MSKEFADLYHVIISPEGLSRGAVEKVPLGETTVFDFIPPIIGSRFSSVEGLKKKSSFLGRS